MVIQKTGETPKLLAKEEQMAIQKTGETPKLLAKEEQMAIQKTGETPKPLAKEEQGLEPKLGRKSEEPDPNMGIILREVLWISIPTVLVGLLSISTELINTVLVGRTGSTKALASVGLGNMMQNLCGFTICFGLQSGLDTLVSQAYGAGHRELMQQYLQRCRCIMLLQLLWIVPLFHYTKEVIVFLRLSPELGELASAYNKATIPGLFALFYSTVSYKYLANQRKPLPGLAITFFISIAHVTYGSYFVQEMEVPNQGAGIANSISWWLSCLCAIVYLSITEYPHLQGVLFVTRGAFRDWGSYLYISLPALATGCTEAWFWEVCCLLCGYLGDVALATHVSVVSFAAIVFMSSYGLHAAAATLVGNAIGANLPRKAEKTAWFCVRFGCLLWVLICGGIIMFRRSIAKMYTPEKDVEDFMADILIFYAFSGFGHTTQNVLMGVFRGLGMNIIGTVVYVASFYGIMLPLACLLGFVFRLGLYGFWIAFFIGTLAAALFFAWFACNVDFAKVAAEAQNRMDKENKQNKLSKDL